MTHRSTYRRCKKPALGIPAVRVALLLLFLLVTAPFAAGQVRVWEGTLKLPVYEEGAPDSNPPFDEFSTNRFSYPYTLRTEITSQRVEHDLRSTFRSPTTGYPCRL